MIVSPTACCFAIALGAVVMWLASLRKPTASWEPMLSSATAGVVVAAMSMTVIAGRADAACNLVLAGIAVFGVGLMGFISRRESLRLFLSAAIMMAGAFLTALGWRIFLGRFVDIETAAAAAALGGVWIAAGVWLLRLESSCKRLAADKSRELKKSDCGCGRFYALLAALAVVVLIGVLSAVD